MSSAGNRTDLADRRRCAPARIGFAAGSGAGPKVLDVLFEGPLVRLAAWRCPVRVPGWSEERVPGADNLAFPRDVPFAIEAGGESIVADRNVVLLHPAGKPYRTSHPFGTGDRGLIATMAPGALPDAVSAAAPGARRPCALRSPRAHLLQEILFRRAAASGEPDAVEELSRRLVDEALASRPAPARSLGRAPGAAIERVRARLGRDLPARIGLAELAAEAGYSPFHLARMFRRATGLTLRRYRLRARLFAALPRVLEARSDLMQIGIDLGFSSHSHMTAAFRGEFGLPPSELRRLVREASLGAIAARLRPETGAP